jgi:hypothetical protein
MQSCVSHYASGCGFASHTTTTYVGWKKQEATILALGAVVEGWISGLLLHLSHVPLPLLEFIPWFQNPLFFTTRLLRNHVCGCMVLLTQLIS